jgi:class 3 adenylate cyclase
MFFSDITGFSGVTTDYPPEVWIDALYEYMSHMTGILFQYEGVLDNYEGDSIMGLFGVPKAYDDHASKVADMRHVSWKSERSSPIAIHQSLKPEGLDEFPMGIIHHQSSPPTPAHPALPAW